MTLRLLPIIRVHCWGGLGSQLFAWAFFEELILRFPKRRIKIYLHTGGVTNRASEIDFLFEEDEISNIEDFLNPISDTSLSKAKLHTSISLNILKASIIKLLLFLGILSYAEDSEIAKKIKPWVISIRGHYSYFKITKETIRRMHLRALQHSLDFFPLNLEYENFLGLHYRLGDLLILDTKSHIEFPIIFHEVIEKYDLAKTVDSLVIFSDSPTMVTREIRDVELNLPIIIPSKNTWDTIQDLTKATYFVGTNSKISLWIVILRYFHEANSWNFLPEGLHRNLLQNVEEIRESVNVRFY